MSFNSGAYVLDSDILQLIKLQQSWTPFTPSWGASSAPTLGNGTIAGEFVVSGKLIISRIRLDWGSTTSGGSGSWSFGISNAGAVLSTTGQSLGLITMRDNSAASHFLAGAVSNTTTTVEGRCHGNNVADATKPFTWAVGDFLAYTIIGELN